MKLKWSVHKDSDYCLCVPNFLSDDEIKHFRTINKDQKFLRAGTRHRDIILILEILGVNIKLSFHIGID